MESVFRDRLLEGKVCAVTGGGSGINLALAERFAAQGAKVGLIGRTPEKLEAAAKTIGPAAMAAPADVRDPEKLGGALKSIRDRLGEIDVLVAGAAGNFPAPALGMSPNGFKAVVDIDLLGTFNTFRLGFEHLRRPGASLIAISATQGQIATALQAHVCAAKAGVDLLVKSLALEWGPLGVRVNAIVPGPTEGTEGMKRLTPTDETRAALMEQLPLRRFGTKSELADLALFLCTPAAAYVTGALLHCDGGLALAAPAFRFT